MEEWRRAMLASAVPGLMVCAADAAAQTTPPEYGADLNVTIHHMTGTKPAVIFLHYWGQGPAEQLARGVRSAVDLLGKGAAASAQ